MKRIFEIKFVVLILVVFSLSAFGQSNEQIEQELVGHIKNIQKWSNYGSEYNEELLSKENTLFHEKLLKYTKMASTLKYNFSVLDEFIFIATSEDGKFRIYSWDTESGGTMHSFGNVYQFQGKDGNVFSKSTDSEEFEAGAFVSDIFEVDTKAGKVYLARFSAIFSTQDASQSINLFKIEGNSLNDKVKLIKTKSGLTNLLSVGYNFFSVVNREERPIKLILYDKQTKTIKIPVVIEDKEFPNGRVTDRFINYKFNGTYFVKVN